MLCLISQTCYRVDSLPGGICSWLTGLRSRIHSCDHFQNNTETPEAIGWCDSGQGVWQYDRQCQTVTKPSPGETGAWLDIIMKTPSRLIEVHWHAGEYYLKINKEFRRALGSEIQVFSVRSMLVHHIRAVKLQLLLQVTERSHFCEPVSGTSI